MKYKIGFIAIAGLIAFSACKKKEVVSTEPVIQPGDLVASANLQELKSYFAANLSNATQTFTMDEDAGQTIVGAKGTTIQFMANSFLTLAGGPVTGNITIELVEIFEKKDMVMMNAPTSGRALNGQIVPLISGGEIRVIAKQGGQMLKLAPGMGMQTTMPTGGTADPNMTLFYGEGESNPDTLVWNTADSAQFFGQGSTYNFWSDSINWINCDYFYSNPNPQTTLQATPPTGLNNGNMLLFVSFDGLNTMTNIYNFAAGKFTTAPSYTLPIGLPIHLIAIAMINGSPYVSIVPTTITNNQIVTIPNLTQMTSAQLSTALGNLP